MFIKYVGNGFRFPFENVSSVVMRLLSFFPEICKTSHQNLFPNRVLLKTEKQEGNRTNILLITMNDVY